MPALFSGCISQKKLVYFQQKTDTITSVPFDTSFIAIIHANDILNVFVTSINQEASKIFNFSDRPDNMGSPRQHRQPTAISWMHTDLFSCH